MSQRISLIGCGRMGSALAVPLITAGEPLLIWDRNPQAAESLAGNLVQVAATSAEAFANADIVLACVNGYDGLDTILDGVGSLSGKILINATSGSVELADQMAKRVEDLGGGYLDAEILTRPEEIGTASNIILISGPAGLWEKVSPKMKVLAGDFRYVGEAPGAANALVIGAMGPLAVAGSLALLEGVRYSQSVGLKVDDFLSLLDANMEVFRETAREGFLAMASGDYRSDSVSIETGLHAAETYITALKARNQRADMLEAAAARLREGVDTGLGELGIFALDGNANTGKEAEPKTS